MRVITPQESVLIAGSRNDVLAVERNRQIEYKDPSNPPKMRFKVYLFTSSVVLGFGPFPCKSPFEPLRHIEYSVAN